MSCYYGLRRSEVLGLRWSAIDMEHKTISISHKVIEAEVDGKFVPMGEDVLKTKSSFRTLPLIPAVGIILLEEKEKQEMYRRLFKKVTAGTTSTTSALTSAENFYARTM